jgi:DNA ligase-1
MTDGDGSITHFSRNGNQFQNFGAFDEELIRLFRGQGTVVADCEAISKKGFQRLMRVPTHYDPNFDPEQLRLMVFDWMTQEAFEKQDWDLTQEQRLTELTKLFKGFDSQKVQQVETRVAKDMQDLTAIYEYWVGQGLEGVIIKQPDGLYEFKRTDFWQKLKPHHSQDLRVVDIELGDANKRWKNKCGSLVVERTNENGDLIRIGVASGLTNYDHENIQIVGEQIIWKSPSGEMLDIKGKFVEVIYDCETEDGSFRFPRIKRRPDSLVRTDK